MTVAEQTKHHPVVAELDARIEKLLGKIQNEGFYKVVMDPESDPKLVQAIMKEVYQEIVWYQPTVIEKTISIIGQFPRSVPEKTIRAMLVHQAEEFSHGEMALRDLIALGGNEAEARSLPMSPAAHATAAFWCMLEHLRKPAAYLGALYMFEGLTPQITGIAKSSLRAKGLTDASLEFFEFHSTEDIVHQNMVKGIITKICEQLPGAEADILHGYDCFVHVYPIPVWNGAYQRAKVKFGA